MNAVAVSFDQAYRAGGMAQVTSEIEDCYRETTMPIIRRYALEDCLALDYAGHQTRRHRRAAGVERPAAAVFREPGVYRAGRPLRAARRVRLAAGSRELPPGDVRPGVQGPGALNAGPSIIHHRPVTPPPSQMF